MKYQEIKDLAKEQKVRVTDLLALAPQNDPFYTGSPATVEAAEWFRELWERFGFVDGVHLRRVHYRLVSQDAPTMPNGETYSNTEECWSFLCGAGKYARSLGLVPADGFVDRRNPDPHVKVEGRGYDYYTQPAVDLQPPSWEVPAITADLGEITWQLPNPYVNGFEFDRNFDQPYHVELWIEKSTMDDVLEPLAEDLGINYCTSLGFQSITSVVSLLKRIEKRGKPGRILYISDFDPAGDGMPVAVARQIEFWREQYAPDAEIVLQPIALTREQVREYRLPRIPVKESDLRKAHFEERYGEGAVELDALEALHPGSLARIIRTAIEPYRDLNIGRRIRRAYSAARDVAESKWSRNTQDERRDLDELISRAAAIVEFYDGELSGLRDKLAAEMEPIQKRLNDIRNEVERRIEEYQEDIADDLPERPVADENPPDESEVLFDSRRDYTEQMLVYKARQNSGTAE